MEYSIGEVSAILNLSRDMVRYYEKQGAIHSSRNPENNYRKYETMEVFWLLEATQHKSWGIPINSIMDIRHDAFEHNTDNALRSKALKLRDEITKKELLVKRLERVRERIALSRYNVGNYWVERTPSAFACHLVDGRGDEYDRITINEFCSSFIFDVDNLPFFDVGVVIFPEHLEWNMMIKEEYVDALGLKVPGEFTYQSETISLCTYVDIGEVGSFDQTIFEILPEYASLKGYQSDNRYTMRGKLISRGYDRGKFHRIIQVMLPILEN